MRVVDMPAGGLFRAGRWDLIDSFPEAAPAVALGLASPLEDGPRWEDVAGEVATVKCSSTAEAAIGRTIARYRQRVLPAGSAHEGCGIIDVIKNFMEGPADDGEPDLVDGVVPADLFDDLYVIRIPHDPNLVFVDLEHPETRAALIESYGPTIEALGLDQVDEQTNLARAPDRRLTRVVFRAIYELCGGKTNNGTAGIRIAGQPDDAWESFVFWSPPSFVNLTADDVELRWVAPWDEDLVSAAATLNLGLPRGHA